MERRGFERERERSIGSREVGAIFLQFAGCDFSSAKESIWIELVLSIFSFFFFAPSIGENYKFLTLLRSDANFTARNNSRQGKNKIAYIHLGSGVGIFFAAVFNSNRCPNFFLSILNKITKNCEGRVRNFIESQCEKKKKSTVDPNIAFPKLSTTR